MFCAQCGSNNPDGAKFCHKCGIAVWQVPDNDSTYTDKPNDHKIPSAKHGLASPEVKTQNILEADLKGVKGWLLFLCIIFTIIGPLAHVANLGNNLHSLEPLIQVYPKLSDAILFDEVTILVIIFFQIYAGYGLWSVKPNAVSIAQLYLVVSLLFFLIVEPYIFHEISDLPRRSGGDHFIFILGNLLSFAIWFTYLNRSKRVRATYHVTDRSHNHGLVFIFLALIGTASIGSSYFNSPTPSNFHISMVTKAWNLMQDPKSNQEDYSLAYTYNYQGYQGGNGEGASNIGLMLEQGLGLQQSYADAADWYQRALENPWHSAQAELHLAKLYEYGLGVPKDTNKAAELYLTAKIVALDERWPIERDGYINLADEGLARLAAVKH